MARKRPQAPGRRRIQGKAGARAAKGGGRAAAPAGPPRPGQGDRSLPQPVFGEPAFQEGVPTPDPTAFKRPHPSDTQQYQQIQALLRTSVVGFDPSSIAAGEYFGLQGALGVHGPEIVQGIRRTGKMVFHATGDTGASNVLTYPGEISVADQVTSDCHKSDAADRPAFLYHLGDIVYNFGESKYYYDQFYEPYRNYPGPIFAIPGNHDSFVIPGTPQADTPLRTFVRNFCSPSLVITPEAASLHRTAMTQPGVYFTLDAPFVRIIGLFSNALEDPGVISSEAGRWPGVPDLQLEYLTEQLKRVKQEAYAGALLVAVHHPPFSYSPPPRAGGSGGNHGSSLAMLGQIDTICKAQGVYPHAFISGHAHNYQRYTRTVRFQGKDFDVPFVVCGDGGHHVNRLVQARGGQPGQEPSNGAKVDYLDSRPAVQARGLLLEKYDDSHYGYLRISVDKQQLRIGFHQVGNISLPQSLVDLVTVDLASHTMVSN